MRTPHQYGVIHERRPAGFTLLELMIVVVILAIIGSIAIPSATQRDTTRLRMVAAHLVADIEFAQAMSIGNCADPCLVTIDLDGHGYRLSRRSTPLIAITNPATQRPYHIRYDEADTYGVGNSVILRNGLGLDDRLGFDCSGALDEATSVTFTLTLGESTLQVVIDADSGHVSAP